MEPFVQLLFSGLALGAIYALVALGFVIIYRSSQVFNFAQGEFLTLGAFLMASFTDWNMPWLIALALSMFVTGILAALIERTVLRPLVGRPVFVAIIITIFVGVLIRAFVHITWGTDPRAMPTPWESTSTIEVFGAHIYISSFVLLGVGALALGLFFLLIKYTKMGVAMRATSTDQETALALGIPVGRILGMTWFLSAAYAALAGVFFSMQPRSVDRELGYIAMSAFPAIIVGGLESPAGAVIAGMLLGVVQMLAKGYVTPLMGDFGRGFDVVIPYVVMILFLLFRPYGIFGVKEVERA